MGIEFDQYQRSIDRPDGVVSFDEAKDIIHQYIDGQKDHYDSTDDAFALSIFSFRKEWYDFVQLSIDDKSSYRIRFECRYTKKFWKMSWRSGFEKEYHITSVSDLISLVKKYFESETEDYKSFFESLSYKVSPDIHA